MGTITPLVGALLTREAGDTWLRESDVPDTILGRTVLGFWIMAALVYGPSAVIRIGVEGSFSRRILGRTDVH